MVKLTRDFCSVPLSKSLTYSFTPLLLSGYLLLSPLPSPPLPPPLLLTCSAFNQEVTLPEDFECDHCTLQLVRQAREWTAVGGYLFWSCADITISNSSGILTMHVVNNTVGNGLPVQMACNRIAFIQDVRNVLKIVLYLFEVCTCVWEWNACACVLSMNDDMVCISDAGCNAMTCSGHGSCSAGKCVCDRLYSGEFCQNKGDHVNAHTLTWYVLHVCMCRIGLYVLCM